MMLWLLLNLLFIEPSLLDIACLADRQGHSKPPIVEWLTERDHDFQHLRQEHPKTFVFRFKNIDTQPILLQTVRVAFSFYFFVK